MIVKVIASPAVVGGLAIALCDDAGQPLPNQISCALASEVGGDPSTLTVTFLIDGHDVRLEGAA